MSPYSTVITQQFHFHTTPHPTLSKWQVLKLCKQRIRQSEFPGSIAVEWSFVAMPLISFRIQSLHS